MSINIKELWKLFFTFLKIGVFTFGGGYAMLRLIQEEVIKNGWVSEEMLIDFVAISESTPGPFAVNIATYIGTELSGIFGAMIATLGVVLPSFIIILLVAKFFMKFKENKIIKGLMKGLKPAAVGLIASAVISMFLTVFMPNGINNIVFDKTMIISTLIFLVSSLCVFEKAHPIVVIIISAIMGIGCGLFVL